MRYRRTFAAVAAAVALSLVAAGCGDDGEETTGGTEARAVTIGGFNFSESSILAAIYEGALRAEGIKVTVRPNLGSREIVAPALERGEIDLYPGYAATELEFYNQAAGEATPDVQATVDKLRQRLVPKNVTALEPSPAVDANAFAVSKATADRYRLKTLSDLAPVAGELRLGGPPECPSRPFCAAGLERVYGIRFKEFKPLDAGGPLSKAALEGGDVDVALIFSSDGAIAARNLVVLEDDKKLQTADNLIPAIRKDVLDDDIRRALNRVSSALTTAELIQLNKRADVDKEDPETLAREWLQQHGLAKK